jgi:hypothetical protein
MAKAAAMRNLPVMARVKTTHTCVSMEELGVQGKSRPCTKINGIALQRSCMNHRRQSKKRWALKVPAEKICGNSIYDAFLWCAGIFVGFLYALPRKGW